MILFHKKEATKDVETYTQAAQRWLFSQKGKINIVTATAEQVLSWISIKGGVSSGYSL